SFSAISLSGAPRCSAEQLKAALDLLLVEPDEGGEAALQAAGSGRRRSRRTRLQRAHPEAGVGELTQIFQDFAEVLQQFGGALGLLALPGAFGLGGGGARLQALDRRNQPRRVVVVSAARIFSQERAAALRRRDDGLDRLEISLGRRAHAAHPNEALCDAIP